MSPAAVVAATGAQLLVEGSRDIAGDAVIDSRRVCPGSTFVAFVGEKVDGNAYLDSAIDAGAALLVASAQVGEKTLAHAAEAGATVVRAADDDCEAFLLALAHAWRAAHPEWLVVGVTGSVGKTTTKDMLRAGFGAVAATHATPANLNNLIGLPLTILSAPQGTQVMVCEMGMNHFHEIERLSAAAQPCLAVVTNVGTSHVGLLGSREGIARAKAEIVGGMAAHGDIPATLALTSANDFKSFIAEKFARPAGVDVQLVGTGDADDVQARDLDLLADGTPVFEACCADGWSRRVHLNVPGKKAVDDFLLALACLWKAGANRDAACEAIESMQMTGMRLEVSTSVSGVRVIDDSYNAAPNSIAAALDVLCQMECDGRRVAVLGEVGELGAEERRLHGYIGAYAAAKPLDMLVFIGGELAGEMAEAARTMGFSEDAIQLFATVEDASSVMAPVLEAGDTVLVKASRSAGLDRFAKEVLAK